MIHIIRQTNLVYKLISFVVFCMLGIFLHGQELSEVLCRDFISSPNLYILKSEANTTEFTTSHGENFSLVSLVKRTWPKKKIVVKTIKEYESLLTVDNEFFITIQRTKAPKSKSDNDFFTGILLQKGKVVRDQKREVYWMNINIKEIKEGLLGERFIYALNNLNRMVTSYDDGSARSKEKYKIAEFDSLTNGHRVLLRKKNLPVKLQIVSDLKEVCLTGFKIVTDEEWENMINHSAKNTMFIEINTAGEYASIDVYTANGGLLVMSYFPWKGKTPILKESLFNKMF